MYTVLIVDDEKLARFVLKNVLEDKLDNLKVIGEADTGDEALLLYDKLAPDIVFMDIHMPGTNGLDAAALMLNRNPEASIFILTAYDYFDYMQQAIEMGVKGYILKPMEIEQVVELVEKVQHYLGRKKQKAAQANTMLAQVNEMIPVVEEEFIRALISGETKKRKVDQFLSFLKLEFTNALFMALRQAPSSSSTDEGLTSKQEASIKELLTRHLKPRGSYIVGSLVGRSIPVFYFNKENDEIGIDKIRQYTEEVARKISLILKIEVVIGIGEMCNKIENLMKSYNHALLSLNYIGGNRVVYYPQISDERNGDVAKREYPFDLEKKLVRKIGFAGVDECKQIAEDIVSYLFAKNKELSVIKTYLENFLVTLKKQLIYIRVPLESIQLVADIGEMHKLHDRSQIKVWTYRAIERIMRQVELAKADRKVNVFQNILAYIDESYTNEISLDLVASSVGLSPQYVSKLFKEKLGINFIEYVTEKKIEVAKRLLQSTELKIKEVAIQSGYSDANYFCKIFKRETGLTPKDYHGKLYKV